MTLKELAKHKGSAFGLLGQPPQPSTEQFANILYDELEKLESETPVWLEDESRNIGSVFMPEKFYLNMQDTHVIVLLMDVKEDFPGLLKNIQNIPQNH